MRFHFRIIFTLLFLTALPIAVAIGATSAEIQSQIDQKAKQIQALQEEIKQYEQSLDQTSSKAKSLKNELATLTTAKKKLETELKLTETKISKTSNTIKVIAGQIVQTEEKIQNQKEYLRQTLRDISNEDNQNVISNFLANRSFSSVSDYIVATERLSNALESSINDLRESEASLSNQKSTAETTKTELSKLKQNLVGEQKAVTETANQKDKLLADTKGQEANYQKILDQKKALMLQFEKELFDYESNLGITVNTDGYPNPKHGILGWPLTKIIVTQMFGKTSFSGRLYASGTHNGTDFGASDGTPVHASLGGVVRATGNTDLKKNCYSYGKWVLVDHPNGLSTLYAHLSSIMVNSGQKVESGDTIAYSGRTGYVTGPHLHLSLLASASTKVMVYPPEKAINCGGVTIPIAPPTAFLDPMAYLPSL